MDFKTIRLAVAGLFLTTTLGLGAQPATQPVAAARPTAAAPRPPGAGAQAKPLTYGAEKFRLVNQDDEIVSVLQNGATIIAKRVDSPVLAVRGYVYTGGVYEGRWLGGGLSHLLEHLVAGGSTQERTEAENREILQQLGNNSNAYTTTDHTGYFINTTPENLDKAVDLLTGWLLGARITPEEYAREYEVVQRELEKGKGEPRRQFYYLSNMNRYRVSPARVPVIGYQEVIRGLSRDDVYEYYKLTYQPNNMVFAIAGNVDPETMLQAFQRELAAAEPGRVFNRDLPDEPAVFAPRTVVATFPKLGQAMVSLGFPSIRLDHPDLYALDLLAAALSWGESSLLVEEIRDKQGLVSGISASSYTPEYVEGTFSIGMQLQPEKLPQATTAVLDLLEKVKAEGISEERLQRAKTQVRTQRVRGMQTAEDVASTLAGDYMSTGDPHFSERYSQRMQEVTPEQVKAVANKYLDSQKLITTTLLPAEYVGAEGLPRAEDLIRPVAPTTQPKEQKQTSEIQKVELDNGTVLLLKRITTTPLVDVKMFTLGGVTAEDETTNGLGNLTMGLLTRGTENRSAQQIAGFFDSIGGDISAGSGNNTWTWSSSFLKEDFEKAMEVFADVVHNPSFPEPELEQMKQRIIAAIRSQEADWTQQAFKFFKEKYYGPLDSPYQFQTIGTEENVQKFTREDVARWYKEKVLPGRRVMAIFGDIDLEQARQIAAKHFGDGPRLVGEPPALQPAKPTQARSTPGVVVERVEVLPTQQPLAGVVIGYDSGAVIGGKSTYPLNVIDTMTSGWGYPTGYLHEILRGHGLVYVVHGMNQPGQGGNLPGSFIVYAGADPKNVNKVVDLILQNIARTQGSDQDMQGDWFDRSKQLVITSDAMDNETAAEQATTAALDELFGLGYDFHDRFGERIGQVSLEDVQQTARQRLTRAVVTITTPAPELVEIKPGPREYTSFPEVDLTPKDVAHDAGEGH